MMQEQTSIQAQPMDHINADRADRMTAWWPRSPASQIESRVDRDQIAMGILALSKPCSTAWLMARVLALLTPYFTASVPEGVRVLEAEDWNAALAKYPQWAIEKAARWWKSDENPHRNRKPIEGDIAERAKFEMGILTFGALMVRRYDQGFAASIAEPEREAPTPEQMAHRRAYAQSELRRNGFVKAMPKDEPTVLHDNLRETVTDEDRAEMAAMLGAAK